MLELTRMVDLIGTKFHEFKAPFLTMHGTADVVADPEGSKNFYMKSTSADKTLKLYDGSYHSLIQGEPDESRSVILADIKAWLDERVNPN
jgi:caffeoylshikimate esterase